MKRKPEQTKNVGIPLIENMFKTCLENENMLFFENILIGNMFNYQFVRTVGFANHWCPVLSNKLKFVDFQNVETFKHNIF